MIRKDLFLTWFQQQVQNRWAKCEFTGVELSDWYWRLKGFDEATLTDAARRHAISDEPKRPSLKKVYAYAKSLQPQQKPGKRKEPTGVPAAHTYIQCVAKDERGCGPVGWFVPILLWPFHRTYTQAHFQQAAADQLALHRRARGGVWEIVSAVTERDMNHRQAKLTGEWDTIQKNIEKLRNHIKAFRKKAASGSNP